MKFIKNRGFGKGILLAPQTNHCYDLSYHKIDENFGLIENFICKNQSYFQLIFKILVKFSAVLTLVYKILQILLLLWSHPRPYII